jgi:hypothetical protein
MSAFFVLTLNCIVKPAFISVYIQEKPMAQTYNFSTFSLSAATVPANLTQTRFFLGTQNEDSVTLSNDPLTLNNFTTTNGNMSWVDSDGTFIGINSEVDYLSTDTYYYMNLNTDRSATVGFVMNDRSRAIISNEWLERFNSGDLTISYVTGYGEEGVDTVISGAGGDTILADYDLRTDASSLSTIGVLSGGIIIDFGLA